MNRARDQMRCINFFAARAARTSPGPAPQFFLNFLEQAVRVCGIVGRRRLEITSLAGHGRNFSRLG
jgi:hypothetical protein